MYTLDNDLPFYTRYSLKVLAAYAARVADAYALPFALESVYYPWNRTFEVGFCGRWAGLPATSAGCE